MKEKKYQITVRFTEDEQMWLMQEAKRRGLPLANFIVSCCNLARREQANEKIDVAFVLNEISNSLKNLDLEKSKIAKLEHVFYGVLGGVSAIRTENLMTGRSSSEKDYWADYKRIASDSARSFVRTGGSLKNMLETEKNE